MPPMLTDEDLNLPEVSDYSFSFQIPNSTLDTGDDLMADDNTFFEGVNFQSVLATPAPSSWTTTKSHFNAAPSPSRPTVQESSPARHHMQTQLTSKPPGASSSCAKSEQSPIIEAPLLSNNAENFEVEISREAEGVHEHQQEAKESHFVSTTNLSTTLNDVPPMQSTFLRRSPLESQSEVGYSGPDLPQDDQRPSADSGVIDRGAQEKLRRRTSTKPPKNLNKKRSTIAGGNPRSNRKAAKTRRVTSASSSTSPTQHQPPAQADKPLGQSAGEELNCDLLACASAEEATGHVVMKSQLITGRVDDKTGTTANETEPNRGPEINTLTPGVDDIRGDVLNLDGQLDEPAKDRVTETAKFETQAAGQELELELSQLSPRKRSLRRYKAMERQTDGVIATSPTFPVIGLASRSSKKRTAPATTPNRDHRVKKRKGNVTTESEIAEEPLAPIVVPAEATRSTVEGSLTLVASSDSTETELSRGAVGGLDLILENEGGGAEESVDVGKDFALAMDSKSGCENNLVPGMSTSAKGRSKRLSGPGTRTRVRRSIRLSSSANVGKSLQGRSNSSSAHARGAALRASERGRRIALVRARQEARDKKKSNKTTEQQTELNISSNTSGDAGIQQAAAVRRTRRTRLAGSKSGSERRMEAQEPLDPTTSRSASSLFGGTGDDGRGPIKPARSIFSVKANVSQRGRSHASRKENVRPVTIPQPFSWATDQRVEERRHFDDTIKEKERERELQKEQKEREREEEEGKEIRELRKRAVPKANTVPEWYKDAPRKRKVPETIGSGSQ